MKLGENAAQSVLHGDSFAAALQEFLGTLATDMVAIGSFTGSGANTAQAAVRLAASMSNYLSTKVKTE